MVPYTGNLVNSSRFPNFSPAKYFPCTVYCSTDTIRANIILSEIKVGKHLPVESMGCWWGQHLAYRVILAGGMLILFCISHLLLSWITPTTDQYHVYLYACNCQEMSGVMSMHMLLCFFTCSHVMFTTISLNINGYIPIYYVTVFMQAVLTNHSKSFQTVNNLFANIWYSYWTKTVLFVGIEGCHQLVQRSTSVILIIILLYVCIQTT